MECSICGKEIEVVNGWAEGNNALPINNGRCCDRCNFERVLPERLKQIAEGKLLKNG